MIHRCHRELMTVTQWRPPGGIRDERYRLYLTGSSIHQQQSLYWSVMCLYFRAEETYVHQRWAQTVTVLSKCVGRAADVAQLQSSCGKTADVTSDNSTGLETKWCSVSDDPSVPSWVNDDHWRGPPGGIRDERCRLYSIGSSIHHQQSSYWSVTWLYFRAEETLCASALSTDCNSLSKCVGRVADVTQLQSSCGKTADVTSDSSSGLETKWCSVSDVGWQNSQTWFSRRWVFLETSHSR